MTTQVNAIADDAEQGTLSFEHLDIGSNNYLINPNGDIVSTSRGEATPITPAYNALGEKVVVLYTPIMQIYIVAKLVLNTFSNAETQSYVSYLDNDMKNTHIDNLQWTTERPKLTVVQPELTPSTDSIASAINLHCNKALFRDTTEFLIRVSRYILTIDSEKHVVTAASIKKTINVIQTVTLEPILDINALLRLKDLPIDEQHTELRLVYSDFIDTLKRNRVGYQSS